MELLDLNWGWFILIAVVIGVTRLLFVRFLPLRLLSVTTAATIGFVFFLIIPILGYFSLFAISFAEYSFYVWIAYVSFLVGATGARQLLGENKKIENLSGPEYWLANFAFVFCTVWASILMVGFFSLGGFSHMQDVIFGGWAHLQLLSEIEDLISNNQGLSFLDISKLFINNIFMCFWVILYKKMPKRSLVIWAVYMLANLGEYISRSTLLGLALVPFFAYLTLNRPSQRRIALLTVFIFIVSLVFFSWDSAVRLGMNYKISTGQVVSDTIRDAGNSAVSATMILSENIRGNPDNYFLAVATFLVPRSIWNDKPSEQYNYMMTYQLTGLSVGHGTSVITSTMLGEAWYYFGWTGAIWLMLMFGFCAYSFENLLTKNIYILGLFFNITYLTIIYIRSTFLAYYQAGIMAVLASLIVMGIVGALSLRQKHIQYTSRRITIDA